MVTKKPVKPFESTLGAGYSTGNTYYGYANVGTNRKKWYLQAGGSYFNSDSFPMSNNYPYFEPGRRQQDRIVFKGSEGKLQGNSYACLRDVF
jgi:hypothetical protein